MATRTYMSNKDLTPNAEFFDVKGNSYPALVEYIPQGDEGFYSPGEICDGDGKPWEGKGQAFFCAPWRPQDPKQPELMIPVASVMVNYGRNESRGNDQHDNPQYWRLAGMHRHKSYVTMGKTAPLTCFWIHRQDWEYDEKAQKWVNGERAEVIRKENAKSKIEADKRAKEESERAALAEKLAKETAARERTEEKVREMELLVTTLEKRLAGKK